MFHVHVDLTLKSVQKNFSLEQVAKEDNCHNTKWNQSQWYAIYVMLVLCYLFCSDNSKIDSRKNSTFQEWLIVDFGLKCLRVSQ